MRVILVSLLLAAILLFTIFPLAVASAFGGKGLVLNLLGSLLFVNLVVFVFIIFAHILRFIRVSKVLFRIYVFGSIIYIIGFTLFFFHIIE